MSFTDLRLETERLLLRPVVERDASALYAIFSDPAVMRYWSSPPWTRIEQAHEMIAEDRAAMREGRSVRFGIERRSDGELLGTCSLFTLVLENRRAEIGYALAHRAWGQGYMHEALVALVRYAFSGLGLNRLEADIDPR
ncbi:MAG: GNAT family N-acetyltransferase, partial [Acidobacteria bacterium]|nr:GNAT family N-acetyltransferase [Acidobacteriota bacterium]